LLYQNRAGKNKNVLGFLNVTNPMNSYKFKEFDMKNKNSDLKIKNPKNLNIKDF